MKTLLAASTAALFLLSSQSALAFSIKISSINKQPAVASIFTNKIETLTLETPEPLPDFSATFITDPLSVEIDAVSNISLINPVSTNASPVPVPAAVWLFGSGLLGLFGLMKRNSSNQYGD